MLYKDIIKIAIDTSDENKKKTTQERLRDLRKYISENKTKLNIAIGAEAVGALGAGIAAYTQDDINKTHKLIQELKRNRRDLSTARSELSSINRAYSKDAERMWNKGKIIADRINNALDDHGIRSMEYSPILNWDGYSGNTQFNFLNDEIAKLDTYSNHWKSGFRDFLQKNRYNSARDALRDAYNMGATHGDWLSNKRYAERNVDKLQNKVQELRTALKSKGAVNLLRMFNKATHKYKRLFK